MRLKGKVALVTGGAVRIGRAVCLALADEGADVVIHYRRSAREARSLRAELVRRGARAFTVYGALDSRAGCARIVREARRAAGGLDILVNNAAVFHKRTLRRATAREFEEEFRPNLFAPALLMSAFARAEKEGQIVNLLDRRVEGLDWRCTPYVLSKKALAELTRMAALELAPRFRVNAVAPGAVLPPPGKGSGRSRDRAGPVPLRRPCTPADIAAAVVFLLRSDSITGQIVFVDGGQHLLGEWASGT